ncbi:MAG: radical SAM family heme chaperone HemW [Myxococcota bacterium]|nr:radical SAM family heme chaperone HemW [Myxococcota bacterium]
MDVGVYVHVPFCERICPYCDFAVVAARRLEPAVEEGYVDALLAELEARRGVFEGRTLASLYLGGGTPSLLRPAALARIVEAVRAAFAPGPAVETTLEVNPGTVERERLPGFRDAGVGRVSLGVQSFDDRTLKRLGRAHRADEARRSLAAARAAGFAAISLDLIFGAPEQDLAGLERDLDEVVAFGPEHVSTYELTLEPGTPFGTAAARGRLRLPEEDEVAAMHGCIEARLGAAGYERYEIASHAKPGFAAVHNRRYWERRPVLGLGVGAFSTDPPDADAPFGRRRSNTRDLATYLERVREGDSAEAGPAEVLDPATARGEAAFLALRESRGLDAGRFEHEFGRPPRGFWPEAIESLVGQGLLCEDASGGLRLTARGRLFSDGVFQHFV